MNPANNVLSSLTELRKDPGVSRNVKDRIDKIISHLQDPVLGKDKALVEIEDMVDGNDMQPYIRAQIWNVMSMIEMM